jgi:hypothetical protein
MFIETMNFDTRTVIDVITLSDDLRKELQSMVDDELTFLLSTNDFTDDDFFNAVYPQVKDQLKMFFKSRLKTIDMPILKGMVNLNSVDYKYLIDHITKI